MKKKYQVVLDGRVIATRKTHRTYTHVVAYVSPERVNVINWCGRYDLAVKAAAGYDVRIIPVVEVN